MLFGQLILTVTSYGLFKAADKKLLKNNDLAEEFGVPEKLVEMYVLSSAVHPHLEMLTI